MTIAPGYTREEVRAVVLAYEQQPYGTKTAWLNEQGITTTRLYRWRNAVFDGDLDRGLVPRDSESMTATKHRRRIAEKSDEHSAEKEQLHARIRELEETNEALGKAIGLLHQLNEHEPDDTSQASPDEDQPQQQPEQPE